MTFSSTRRFPFTIALPIAISAVCLLAGCKREETKAEVPPNGVPGEFTVAALKAAPPEQAFDSFRKAMEREDLTEEQRRQIMENGREAMEQRMDERMTEYFSAPEPERKRILDKSIDEFEKMRKDREAREAEREKMSEEDREKERQKWRERMGNRDKEMTQAERKNRSETRSADKMGKRMAYISAISARMKERGIEPPQRGPFGGPGGPGGPGGRRGGG